MSATVGLTVTDAFRLMMMRIAKDKAWPFEPLIPNAETAEAMMAIRRGDVTTGPQLPDLYSRLIAAN